MAGSASEIQHALQLSLAAIPGLRVADHLPEQITPPMAVASLQTVTYHRAMRGGLSTFEYVVTLLAGRMGTRAAQLTMDGWISYDGNQSVRAIIESDPTLGGKCSTLIVSEMIAVRPVTIGDEAYFTCEFTVIVHA